MSAASLTSRTRSEPGTAGARDRVRHGLALCGLLILSALVAPGIGAAESVRLPDGDLLTVWERRTRMIIPEGGGNEGQAIAYSVSNLEGTLTGTVGPTADLLRDAWPRLVVDPSSGWPALFWSRHDGLSLKIAHARYGPEGWSGVRYVTFGSGNDVVPRVAVGSEGAYLFWVAYETGRYMYAPVDLAFGHLVAAPRTLSSFVFPVDLTTDYQADTSSAFDVPVVTGLCPEPDCSGSSLADSDGGETQGGVDAPVVTGSSASIWSASGDEACRSQILVLPSAGLTTGTVVRFTRGYAAILDRVAVPSPVSGGFGDLVGASYLRSTCD